MTSVELSIGGMTCASCAARIEKKLNKLDGVTATVNYATEKARVAFGDDVTPDQLVAAVRGRRLQAAGYPSATGRQRTSRSTTIRPPRRCVSAC